MKTAVQRTTEWRAEQKKRGLVPVTVWVHKDLTKKVRDYAGRKNKEKEKEHR